MVRASLLAAGAALVLAACAAAGRHVTDWGEIRLAPGDTGTCQSNPCRVLLEMPPGTGTYQATANEVGIGAIPAGRTVSIGSFFESQAVKFPGSDLQPVYVYIPNVR